MSTMSTTTPTTTTTTEVMCNQWQFRCVNSRECIESHKRCDGKRDCDDSSDEHNCPIFTTTSTFPRTTTSTTMTTTTKMTATSTTPEIRIVPTAISRTDSNEKGPVSIPKKIKYSFFMRRLNPNYDLEFESNIKFRVDRYVMIHDS